MKKITPLNKAIEHAGSQAALARLLGVNSQLVYSWGRRGVPPKRAKQIEQATGGAVTRRDLCPELFL